ncbi:acyltransferase [Methanomethylovorans sp.]|uniref:acyltransferase n=1 Tax=Methanomethylovorans sp. TaxID=2758717 RepID=UPI003D13876A
MTKPSENWFEEINYLRAIAIIGVLIIHTIDDTAAVKNLTGLMFSLMYIEELVRFAVPMFIFVSGFVLYNKYRSELPVKDFYKKRFMSILIPYIIFSVIYCIVNTQLGLFPAFTLNSVIDSIFNFTASGHFWYFQLILTFYIFYPAIIAYYEITKDRFEIHLLFALFSPILIMYVLGSFIPSFGFALSTPFKYLIYFLFGIYTKDNYDKICRRLERISMKKILLLGSLIASLPFVSMFLVVDSRYGTQFSNSIPYYYQLTLVSTNILHICIFMFCLNFLLIYKPKFTLLQKTGEYSYGIFLVHALFHNFLLIYIFPRFSIFPTSLNFYIILFALMLTMSYFTVKLMLKNRLTSYMITGKLTNN